MKKTLTLIALVIGALMLVAGGTASAKHRRDHPRPCPHKVGYVASGTLTQAATLTQVAGAGTTDTRDDRYSGTLVVNVTHGNFHAKGTKGVHTYNVSNIRLGKNVTSTPPAGTRVRLIGTVTRAGKKCPSTTTGTGVVTVRRAVLHAPKPAPTA